MATLRAAPLALAALCGLGCASGSATDEPDPGPIGGGAAAGPVEPPPAPLDADGAAAALDASLAWPLPDPAALDALYLSMMHAGDSRCPGPGDQLENGSIPLEGCTSSTGYTYEGLSEYHREESADARSYELAIGDFYVLDPTGARYAVGGTHAYEASWSADGAARWSAESTGTFVWTGGQGWLAEGASIALWYEGGASDAGAGWLQLEGGLGTLDGDPALFAHGLSYAPDGDGDRPVGLAGELRLRDPSGWWYAFALEGGGCGTVAWADGAPLGTVCVDDTPFAATLAALDPR